MDTINGQVFPAFAKYTDRTIQIRRGRTWTYGEAAAAFHGVALELRRRGVQPGDRVALIAENGPRWLYAFLGTLAVGAVAVTRGTDIGDDELRYILEHSGSRLVFAETGKVAARLPADAECIRFDEGFPDPAPLEPGVLEAYAAAREPHDLAVLLYTSGTTGHPKGVMLEQRNIGHNIRVLPPIVDMQPGDGWVSILPPWHTFEQTIELCGLSAGCYTVYTDRRRLRDDLREHRPHFFGSVPRIWETIYQAANQKIHERGPIVRGLFGAARWGSRAVRHRNPLGWPLHLLGKKLFYGKIAAATGGRLKYAISGGGFMPPHIDEFFADVGITLLVGYGLTETAPVVAVRRPEDNVLGTIGRAVPETEFRVSPGGTLQVRGPQVMRGYYKDDELTRRVLSEDGWFDTGDIVKIVDKGDLVFVGRAKETIVLSGGENIEPEPIENRVLRSHEVEQVMLVGQDRKTLGALVVAPDASDERVTAILRACTGPTAGFRSFETVHKFARIDEPFSVENGLLTQTMKMRRNAIAERYAAEIDSLY